MNNSVQKQSGVSESINRAINVNVQVGNDHIRIAKKVLSGLQNAIKMLETKKRG